VNIWYYLGRAREPTPNETDVEGALRSGCMVVEVEVEVVK
jgi:hypothetical protein